MKNYKVYKTRAGAARAYDKLTPLEGYENEHAAKAKASRKSAADSFERCDTDGFVSQWSSNLNGDKESAKHRVKMHDGRSFFRVLVYKDTKRVASTKLFTFDGYMGYDTAYKWLVDGEWITDFKRLSNFHKKGLDVAWIIAPAYVDYSDPLDRRAPSYGLSGALNVRPKTLLARDEAGLTK